MRSAYFEAGPCSHYLLLPDEMKKSVEEIKVAPA